MSLIVPFQKWTDALGKRSKKLQTLNKSSEGQFLDLGSRLQEFYIKAKEISNLSSSVANQLAGHEISVAIDGLQKLLNKMNGHVTQTAELSEQSENALNRIENKVEKIYKPIKGFKKIVRTLNILGISTRIENASINIKKSDFNILADEVKKLAIVIDSKSDNIIDHSKSLDRLIEHTLSKIVSLRQQQQDQARVILNKIKLNLTALVEKQNASRVSIEHALQKSRDIYGRMGEVVSSMQFHDITRQQIEHVIVAFDELTSYMKSEFQESDNVTDQADIVRKVYDVCGLQKAQIHQSEKSLITAVNNIFSNLQGIAASTNQFSTDIYQLAGVTDNENSSFLSDIESDITLVSASLSENAKDSKEMANTINTVADTIVEMSKFLSDIENIGTEIEMIALNAIVKASHIGSKGAALSVLAEYIKDLSVETRTAINKISPSLREISNAADSLIVGTKSITKGRTVELKGLDKELGDFLNTLNNINKNMASFLYKMNDESHKLVSAIEKDIAGFSVHTVFSNILGEIKSGLDEIIKDALDICPELSKVDMADSINMLESRYTMASERAIHKSHIMQQNPATVNIAIEEPGHSICTVDEERLGDNVELF